MEVATISNHFMVVATIFDLSWSWNFNTKAHGHISLFTYKRTIQYVTPKLTVGYRSIRALATRVTSIATTERLKRENFRHTNFDSAFSAWKILSGPFDWENYSTGKEGAEKYRTQNLPNTSCPGLYELGVVATLLPRHGRRSRKIKSSSVIVVYLGQSENLRARAEQYGRNGAHLENSCGLFSDTFSKGCAIVYRCAPMETKRDAEELEDELLRKYDYAWNKRRNGDRRPDDIHKKLEPCSSKSHFPLVNWFQQNNSPTRFDSEGILSRIFGIIKLRQKKVGCGSNEHSTSICGAATANGSICAKPPVPGRKRCAEHKGLNKAAGVKAPNIISADQNQRSNKSRVTRKPYGREHPINERLCSYFWSFFGR